MSQDKNGSDKNRDILEAHANVMGTRDLHSGNLQNTSYPERRHKLARFVAPARDAKDGQEVYVGLGTAPNKNSPCEGGATVARGVVAPEMPVRLRPCTPILPDPELCALISAARAALTAIELRDAIHGFTGKGPVRVNLARALAPFAEY